MEKIAIIGAMKEEVAILKAALSHRHEKKIAGARFYCGTLKGKQIILLESGIGKVNAAIGTALLCDRYQPDIIINTGSAGGIVSELNIGDVIISDKLVYGDVDAMAFDYAFGQVPQMPPYYQSDQKLLKLAEEVYSKHFAKTKTKAMTGLIVTTDSFIYKKDQRDIIKQHFPEVKAVEMEATAIAQTAYQFDIPFMIVRAISDVADKEASVSFDTFLAGAAKESSACVIALLEKL